ncbi:MAG: bifunctional phosphopantothenoylcysteine decarboxylase/phosphopantothenate--cysteine ligase CoaBC [Deltaproteobacteria bacterium HGW-Deltaproteobacteria-9]|nr:MAG: bifunctional phosphopantothenoylcysteine decarboxylase/phosphopantothenate--cysteine ligase CoaBC [Deltaproteobacteria bacterium HGW-Deltaproteobacteria-9]
MLKGKHILLGVTGGIAAYKSAELIRLFIKTGCSVKVIMTRHATEFITPLTLQTLSGNPVFMDMFSLIRDHDIAHIALAEEADVLVIAPATANIIGKMAAGLADDLLTTVALATKAPVLICPAMNTNMYENAVVRENMRKLASRGCRIMAAGEGELACKTEGSGRLPDIQDILDEVQILLTEKDLAGKRILVTAGPTREPFDPVRFITNYSSGKMGYALAIVARRRGAAVTLISGPTVLPVPSGVDFIPVSSALEMREAVMQHLKTADMVIKSAAVADFRPSTRADDKIKKKSGPLTLTLERNPDILAEIGKKKEGRILIGFAMESEDLVENAKAKLIKKNLDLIVANDVKQSGAGFQTDTNIVKILDRAGGIEELPLMDKMEVAARILDRAKQLFK